MNRTDISADYLTTYALEQAERALRQRVYDYEERIEDCQKLYNRATDLFETACNTGDEEALYDAKEALFYLGADLESLMDVRRRALEAHEEVMGVLSLRRS